MRAAISSVGVMTPGSKGKRAPRRLQQAPASGPGSRRIVRQRDPCRKVDRPRSVFHADDGVGDGLAHGFDGGQRYRVRRVISSTPETPADKARASGNRMLDLGDVRRV